MAAAILAVAPSSRAAACICMAFPEAERLARADMVFEGVVADSQPGVFVQGAGQGHSRFTFAVEDVVKGPRLPARVEIFTAGNEAACGAGFAMAQRWRVFVTADGERLTSSGCSGNQLLAEKAPVPPAPTAPAGGGIPIPVFIALGGASLLVLASLVAFRRPTALPGG